MFKALRLILLFSVALIVGCATPSIHQDIETEAAANGNIDLTTYKSYTWLLGADVLFDPDHAWKSRGVDYDAEIRFLINQALRDKGMKENNFSPELAVVYGLGVNMKSKRLVHDKVKKIDELKDVPEGGMVIALLDIKSGKPVWIGRAKAALQGDNTVETDQQRIEYVIKQLFDKLYKPDRTVNGDKRDTSI